MSKLFIHSPLFRIVGPAVTGTLSYLLVLLIFNAVSELGEIFYNRELYFIIGIHYLTFEGLRQITLVLDWYFEFGTQPKKRILVQFSASTIYTLLIVAVALMLYFNIYFNTSTYSLELITISAVTLFMVYLHNLVYFGNAYLYQQNLEKLKEERILRDNVRQQFNDFKSDLNPSLLYDSLETLLSLIRRDPLLAEEFIDHLAANYRYILAHKHTELVRLKEDLKATDHIIKLFQENRSQIISFINSINEDPDKINVIPSTLPRLIEVIIRKTLIIEDKPLDIKCYVEDDTYVVVEHASNDKLRPESHLNDTVDKMQKAYSFYSDTPVVEIEAYGLHYYKLPLLKEEVKSFEL